MLRKKDQNGSIFGMPWETYGVGRLLSSLEEITIVTSAFVLIVVLALYYFIY